MALTYTIAGLQTQLDAVGTAIDADDYAAARRALAKAFAVLAGLPQEANALGAVVKMRSDLDKLAALLGETETSAAAASPDRRRLIKTGLRHGY